MRLPLLSTTYGIHKLYVLFAIIVENPDINRQLCQSKTRIIFTRISLIYRINVVGVVQYLMIRKACGKTTTAEQQAKSIIYMDDPTKQQQYKQMAQTNISFLLEGETAVR